MNQMNQMVNFLLPNGYFAFNLSHSASKGLFQFHKNNKTKFFNKFHWKNLRNQQN